jgi:SAM-dependent methyltransferase
MPPLISAHVSATGPTCPVCDSTDREFVIDGHDHLYGNAGTFALWRCRGCGLGMEFPMPSDGDMAAFYQPDYPCHSWREPSGRWLTAVRRMLLCDTTPLDPRFTAPGRMLDIGCGAGSAIEEFGRRGWQAVGVEPNPRAVETGRRRGLDVLQGTLDDARFPDVAFDYVRLDHSFEHVTRPTATLREIRRILRPGGRLFVCVPEFESTTRRLFGEYWWFLGLPVHAYQYSHDTLPRLLERAGFTVERVRVRPHPGGTLWSLELLLNHRRTDPSRHVRPMQSAVCRLLGQWAAVLVAAFGTGDVLEVTSVRSEEGVP